ncbi:MAG: ABC transporter ATP-binding protein [Desulfoplanes sp.]|nr:ABC transporter ATP-binding protein [Desulfoplanes sp.]
MATCLIEVKNLYHIYGSRLIFKDVSLCLEAGSAVLIAGENGAGKSTLLKCVAGLIRPAGGTVVSHVSEHELAYMGHATFIYNRLTALQNLQFWNRMYDLKQSEKNLLELLGRVGLSSFAWEWAGGFSRGMAQRLALARILLLKPRVILLDEPSTGLDTGSCSLLFQEIAAARNGGAGILWVSHDLTRDLQRTDKVLRLADNRVDFWGSSASFKEQSGHVD